MNNTVLCPVRKDLLQEITESCTDACSPAATAKENLSANISGKKSSGKKRGRKPQTDEEKEQAMKRTKAIATRPRREEWRSKHHPKRRLLTPLSTRVYNYGPISSLSGVSLGVIGRYTENYKKVIGISY